MIELVFLALAIACSGQADAGEMKALRVPTATGAVLRSYYLHVPANTPPGVPLVIMLHGAGSSGQDDTVRFGWRRKAESEHFIVVGPDASPAYAGRAVDGSTNPRAWNDGASYVTPAMEASDDVAMIKALIEEIARTHKIDRRRVYLAGFSSGGNMAARVAQEMSERIAAITAAASQFTRLVDKPARAVPVLYFSGDADPANPVEGGSAVSGWGAPMKKEPHRTVVDRWRALNGCTGQPATLPDTNHSEYVEASAECRGDSEVRYVLVRGLGHDWPVDERNGATFTISATNEAWAFFKRFQLPAEPSGN